MIQQRLNKVLKIMGEKKIPQMIVSDPTAIFYLTGKWILPGERMLALYINKMEIINYLLMSYSL